MEQIILNLIFIGILWDRYRAAVPFLLGIAEDERGGSAARREAYGCLPQGSTRGGGKPVQERDR